MKTCLNSIDWFLVGTNQLTFQWFGGAGMQAGAAWYVPGWNRVKAWHLVDVRNEY